MERSLVIHKTFPRIINSNDPYRYITGKCKCPEDERYVLAVNVNNLTLDEKISGHCKMYCPICNTYICVGFFTTE